MEMGLITSGWTNGLLKLALSVIAQAEFERCLLKWVNAQLKLGARNSYSTDG